LPKATRDFTRRTSPCGLGRADQPHAVGGSARAEQSLRDLEAAPRPSSMFVAGTRTFSLVDHRIPVAVGPFSAGC